ncbi:MAG: IclR family transcriptional regulator [Rhodospirillaceae bacterium]
MNKQDTLFVSSLEKGMRVLDAFRGPRDSLGITEIAEATNMDKSAAQRFTNTLHRLGYLERDPHTRRYRPAIKLLDFSFTYLQHDHLAEVSVARLIEAGKVHGTTVNLCVLAGTDIIYTVRIPHQKASYAATIPGRRVPAFCTAGGLAILAFRPADEAAAIVEASNRVKYTQSTITDRATTMKRIAAVRDQGYAVSVAQLLLNEISIAAPVLDSSRRGVAAVHIPVYQPQWSLEAALDKLAPLAMETARSISGTLWRND